MQKLLACLATLCGLFASINMHAAQIDIPGPAGSGKFGEAVVVLPNGNIVVADPAMSNVATNAGAVYLYSSNGTLISTLTGSSANDAVGNYGFVVLPSGNFLVLSPNWNNGTVSSAGAVTWVNAGTGLNGTISAANSLIGSTKNDQIGRFGSDSIRILTNGNYIVLSAVWSNGLGAVTWGNGNSGVTGAVSSGNSIIGATAGDDIGSFGIVALANGNYVLPFPNWKNAAAIRVGAAMWASGSSVTSGTISSGNALVGTTLNDGVGGTVTALSNGNYVVGSVAWHNSAGKLVGAATWANGTTGLVGTLTLANSLIGATNLDYVGSPVTALSNGNYVVLSSNWHNSSGVSVGAATWANGTTGSTGIVTAANSLVGSTANDQVGVSASALSNGNYVVISPLWNNGAVSQAGAVTWGNGTTGTVGTVTPSNSLVGSSNDQIGAGASFGFQSITALSNGNYVVASPLWNNGAATQAGAVTWANGTASTSAVIGSSNSLVGSSTNDYVGIGGTIVLSNGNYVIASPNWANGATTKVGAVTWSQGSSGVTGVITSGNSLIGSSAGDQVGLGMLAVNAGNYVIASPYWSSSSEPRVGAVTWRNGAVGSFGLISAANSLVGSSGSDFVGADSSSLPSVFAQSDGNFVVQSSGWTDSVAFGTGAVTLSSSRFRLKGTVRAFNSVINTVGSDGSQWVYGYDATLHRVAVGRPADNLVSLFTMDQIFFDDFE